MTSLRALRENLLRALRGIFFLGRVEPERELFPFPAPSSNRTCGFPAYGFPINFHHRVFTGRKPEVIYGFTNPCSLTNMSKAC